LQTHFEIFTGYSPFLIPLCLIGGVGYAYFLYSAKHPWSKQWNYAMAAIRFVLVSILLFLLLGPFIKYVKSFVEKPVIVIAIDNSTSITEGKLAEKKAALLGEIESFKNDVQKSFDVDVDVRTLEAANVKPNEIAFDQASTNLSGLLEEIKSVYENRPLSQIVLVSDGIVNQGNSPLYGAFSFPIHTVGTGDTTEKSDLVLKSVYSNKVAFIGNKFPIVAEIEQKGFKGKEIMVQLLQKGNLIDKKTIQTENSTSISKVEFTVSASSKGLQGYTVQIVSQKGESSDKNNSASTYIDVIDTKTNILLVAPSPHPDIQVLARVIAQNENFEFSYFIPGLTEFKDNQYGLVIFHQVPTRVGVSNEVMNRLLSRSVSAWFIAGQETDWKVLNSINGVLNLVGNNGQWDAVIPALSPDFTSFSLESANKDYISKYPPIDVPFGDVKLLPASKVLLLQKVGSMVTEKPLLAVSENEGRKLAVLLGSGIWQWSLQEYGQFKNQDTFDELMLKLVQYLSTTVDKSKLRVYPTTNEFLDSEKPTFRTEVYNSLYEKVYGQKIDLEIKSESGKKSVYTFYNSEN
jgi:hypothetical protein